MSEMETKLIEEIRKTKNLFAEGIEFNEKTNLVTDLNFNSIDFMQLVVNIEQRFGIAFDMDVYMESEDINLYVSVRDYLVKALSEKEANK